MGTPSASEDEQHYSDDFAREESGDGLHQASASASLAVGRSSRKSPQRGPRREDDEEHYSDSFDEETGEVSRDAHPVSPGVGLRASADSDALSQSRGHSRSGSEHRSGRRSQRSPGSHSASRSLQDRGSGKSSGRGGSRGRSRDSGASGASSDADPRGKVMEFSPSLFFGGTEDIAEEARAPEHAESKGSRGEGSHRSGKARSAESSESSNHASASPLPLLPGGNLAPAPPSLSMRNDLQKLVADIAQLPTDFAHWRAPDSLDPVPSASSPSLLANPQLTPPEVLRLQDAVPRHLKPHGWDLASLGQELPVPKEAWPRMAASSSVGPQPPLSLGLEPIGGGPQGFGGARGRLAASAESSIVERLAQRFVLDRKAPSLEKQERAAYKEMLQQVSWTALEPTVAQETALLLSKRWMAPVSSSEALRAFRRSLHSILCDERVLDIVEHQMALHFGRLAGAAAS